MQTNFPVSVFERCVFACLCMVAWPLHSKADPPVSLGETVIDDRSSTCSVSDFWEFFGASSAHTAQVKIDSGAHSLGLDCGMRTRNMPRLFVGAGLSVTEGSYHLEYASDYLDSEMIAEGLGLGLSLFWKVRIPEGLEFFGGGYAQWVHFFEFDVQHVWVKISEEDDGKFDFSDFAKEHIEVVGGLTNVGATFGIKIAFGNATLSPLIAVQTATVEGAVKADMSAENLLRALSRDSLDSIHKSNTMVLTGLGTSWCSGDGGKYCFFGLVKGGLLATDHWALSGQAGVKVHFP